MGPDWQKLACLAQRILTLQLILYVCCCCVGHNTFWNLVVAFLSTSFLFMLLGPFFLVHLSFSDKVRFCDHILSVIHRQSMSAPTGETIRG